MQQYLSKSQQQGQLFSCLLQNLIEHHGQQGPRNNREVRHLGAKEIPNEDSALHLF